MSRSVVIVLAVLTAAIAGLLVVPHLRRDATITPETLPTSEVKSTPETTTPASAAPTNHAESTTRAVHSHSVDNGSVTLEVGGVDVVLPQGWELLDQPINFFVQERARNAERGIAVSAGAFPMALSLEEHVTIGLLGLSSEQGKPFDEIARMLGIPVEVVERAAASLIGRQYLARMKETIGSMKFEFLQVKKTEVSGTAAYEIQSKAIMSNLPPFFSRQFTLQGSSPDQSVLIGFASPSEDVFQDQTLIQALRRRSPAAGAGAMTYFMRGTAKGQRRDFNGAVADFSQALEQKPDFAEAYNARGMAKGALAKNPGDTAGALADYNAAIALKPDYAEAYYNRALVKQAKGDNAGALADQSKAIEFKPDYPQAYYYRGVVKAAGRDDAGAVTDLNKAIELKPDYASAYQQRGNLRKSKGDVAGAQDDYKKATESRGR